MNDDDDQDEEMGDPINPLDTMAAAAAQADAAEEKDVRTIVSGVGRPQSARALSLTVAETLVKNLAGVADEANNDPEQDADVPDQENDEEDQEGADDQDDVPEDDQDENEMEGAEIDEDADPDALKDEDAAVEEDVEVDGDLGAGEDNENDENENDQDPNQDLDQDQDQDNDNDQDNENENDNDVETEEIPQADRQNAIDALAELEMKFALIRQRLYTDRMDELAREEGWLRNGKLSFILYSFLKIIELFSYFQLFFARIFRHTPGIVAYVLRNE